MNLSDQAIDLYQQGGFSEASDVFDLLSVLDPVDSMRSACVVRFNPGSKARRFRADAGGKFAFIRDPTGEEFVVDRQDSARIADVKAYVAEYEKYHAILKVADLNLKATCVFPFAFDLFVKRYMARLGSYRDETGISAGDVLDYKCCTGVGDKPPSFWAVPVYVCCKECDDRWSGAYQSLADAYGLPKQQPPPGESHNIPGYLWSKYETFIQKLLWRKGKRLEL